MNGIVLTKNNELLKGKILAPNKSIDDMSTVIKIENKNSLTPINVINIAFAMVAIGNNRFNVWSNGKAYTSGSDHFRKLWNKFLLAK